MVRFFYPKITCLNQFNMISVSLLLAATETTTMIFKKLSVGINSKWVLILLQYNHILTACIGHLYLGK